MKRSNSTSCSSDSSSCIESNNPLQQQQQVQQKQPDEVQPKKNKRVRAKKIQNQENSSQIKANANASKRSSIYRGVTRHRWTGRYEAHLWDKSTWNTIQNKRGKQIYLGAYDSEEGAARTYDLAALKYWGAETILNFPVETYTKELEEMQTLSREEYLASLRRRSSGFSRGVSKYRGVARHHHNGRWEARIGRVLGSKYLYLGTYSTQEEAAAAYDMAAIEYRGPNAVTNFDISNYIDKFKKVKPPNEIKLKTPEGSSSIEEQQPTELCKQETPAESSIEGQQIELGKHETPEESSIEGQLNEIWNQQTQGESSSVNEIPHEIIKQEAPEMFFAEEEPFMVHGYQQYQCEQKPLIQAKVEHLEFESSIESESMAVMNPGNQQTHPWDLCLDIGFHSLDIPLDERHTELPDLFNDIDFDDDINLMFGGEDYGIDLNQDPMSCDIGFDLDLEAKINIRFDFDLEPKDDVLLVKQEKGLEASTSSSISSPLSTTTSVSGEV